MKKIHFLSFLLFLVSMLASCSNDSFKIEGNITHLDGDAVRIVFYGDSGIIDETVPLDKKGHFDFKGSSSQLVPVSLLNLFGEPLTMMIVTNGDHLKMKGDASKASSVKVKGNKLNEEWQLFRDEHAGFYNDPNPSRLDAAIEKYVREHPDDLLSTVLLMFDYSNYSDRAKVNAMLNGINATVRPESLTQAFNKGVSNKKALYPRLMNLTLVKHNGDFEDINLSGHVSLISFWANPQKDRNALINKLQNLDEGIRVVDVLAESDTLRWHQTIAKDPKTWQHYWSPGGPVEQGVKLLGISVIPWYVVADSTGLVTYSGYNLDAAINQAKSALK